jgi:di/tricarboxylate transporter
VMLMVISMVLADLVHTSPTAIFMAPIALAFWVAFEMSPDAFLMAVAVGAASPYLTPVGHQSNTLVMGPGGYRFGGYWRMGLPLDVLIVAVAVPMIMWVWVP